MSCFALPRLMYVYVIIGLPDCTQPNVLFCVTSPDVCNNLLRYDIPICLLEYERVYLSLYKVADTPFHVQWDELLYIVQEHINEVRSLITFLLANMYT